MTATPVSGTSLPAVVINIDDVGMCHGANVAYVDLARRGRCDSGSVMVPCPWFLEIVELGAMDSSLKLGVHLTITSEKKYYRWRPLTAPGPKAGLTDGDGFLWRSVPEVRRHAVPEAVEAELRAQIDAFLKAGLKPCHLDAHMGAVLSPEFVDIYIRLGREYGIPILFPRGIAGYGPIHNLGVLDADLYPARAGALEAEGLGLVDRVLETPWHQDQPAEVRYRALFGEIGSGLTFMALHANAPGELEAIEPASAAIRIGEYDVLRSPDSKDFIDDLPVRRGTLADFSSPSSISRSKTHSG
ncbi:polysaccharide deacetylase family protein [Labrys okinawensis]|uniref:polysaccharide deacetylase family protein n=1 Tax=Labrys okinawensis TaxID=346911 RepID=UPI0039BD3810